MLANIRSISAKNHVLFRLNATPKSNLHIEKVTRPLSRSVVRFVIKNSTI